jgi:hypothetical protein
VADGHLTGTTALAVHWRVFSRDVHAPCNPRNAFHLNPVCVARGVVEHVKAAACSHVPQLNMALNGTNWLLLALDDTKWQ